MKVNYISINSSVFSVCIYTILNPAWVLIIMYRFAADASVTE